MLRKPPWFFVLLSPIGWRSQIECFNNSLCCILPNPRNDPFLVLEFDFRLKFRFEAKNGWKNPGHQARGFCGGLVIPCGLGRRKFEAAKWENPTWTRWWASLPIILGGYNPLWLPLVGGWGSHPFETKNVREELDHFPNLGMKIKNTMVQKHHLAKPFIPNKTIYQTYWYIKLCS